MACCLPGLLRAGEDADYRRAHHLYTLHEFKLAAEGLKTFLEAHARSEHAEEARLLLAESLFQLKEYPGAAEQFARYLADFPQGARRAEAAQRAVKTHGLARKYEGALTFAELFLKENLSKLDLANPPPPPALPAQAAFVYYYGGDSAFALKKFSVAKGYWQALLQRFPEHKLLPDAAEGLGWIAFQEDRFEDALKLFRRTAQTPEHPKAAASQVMVARVLEALKQPDKALAALEELPRLAGAGEQAAAAAVVRPGLLLGAGKPAEALAAYRLLAEQQKGAEPAGEALAQGARKFEADKRLAEALELAQAFLQHFAGHPQRPMAARLKARVLAALGRPEEAREAARGALVEAEALPAGQPARAEQLPAALLLLGELDPGAGKAPYERLLKEFPDSPWRFAARYQLVWLLWQAKAYAEAFTLARQLGAELDAAGAQADPELKRKTLFAAADSAFLLERYAEAEPLLASHLNDPAAKTDPAGQQLDLVYLRLAWCRSKAKDANGALRWIREAEGLRLKPEIGEELLYLKGRLLLEQSQLEQGLAALEALWKAAPAGRFLPHAALDAARALYDAGRFPAALSWLERLPGLGTQGPQEGPGGKGPAPALAPELRSEALFLRAKARYKSARLAEAWSDAEGLLSLPGLPPERQRAARFLCAACLEGQEGKAAEALKAYAALEAAGPPEAAEVRQSLLRSGRLLYTAKRYAEAAASLERFLQAVPLQAGETEAQEAAFRLALCLKAAGKGGEAQTWLGRLEPLNPSGTLAFEVPFQLANLAFEAGQDDRALALYEKALEAAKGLPEVGPAIQAAAWLNLAWTRLRLKRNPEAAAAFARVLELDPNGSYAAEARCQRGLLLKEAGDLEGALQLWNQLLEKNPESREAPLALAALGESLARAGRFAEAAAAFQRYLERHPQAAARREVLCGLAECRMQGKQPAEARAAFLEALGPQKTEAELDPLAERALLGLAELALQAGEAQECKRLGLRIILDRPDSKWLDAALYLCARASEELKTPEQAIAYYRKLLAERSGSERAGLARERLKALGAPAEARKEGDPAP